MGATNQTKWIAHEHSGAWARATEPDMCLVPDAKAYLPFGNEVAVELLNRGSSLTTIRGGSIWIASSEVGPPSDPEHEGTGGGQKSKTYRAEARATSYSADLIVEGGAVVRVTDTTTQNHGNCAGAVVQGEGDPAELASEVEFLRMRCSLTPLYGECIHEDGDGSSVRRLGFRNADETGDPYYLEILSGQSVELRTQHVSMAYDPPLRSPKCLPQTHPRWSVTRSGGGLEPASEEHERTETVTVGPSLTRLSVWDTIDALPIPGQIGNSLDSDAEKDFVLESDAVGPGGVPDPQKRGVGVGLGTDSLVSFAKLRAFCRIAEDPPKILVHATGCTGTRNAFLRVFPAQQLSWSLFAVGRQTEGHDFTKSLEKLKQCSTIVQWISKKAGLGEVELAVLVKPKLEVEVGYVPCAELRLDAARSEVLTPARVGRKLRIRAGADPLVGYEVSIKISVLVFLPGLGAPLAGILRKINEYWPALDAYIFFGSKMHLGGYAEYNQDEYGYTSPNSGTALFVKLVLEAALRFAAAGVELSFGATLVSSLTLGVYLGEGVDAGRFHLQLGATGEIGVIFNIVLWPDSWWEYEICTTKPGWLELSFGKQSVWRATILDL